MARKVINTGLSQTELSVEVYPLQLQLHLMPKGDRSAIRISKKVSICVLRSTSTKKKKEREKEKHYLLLNLFMIIL